MAIAGGRGRRERGGGGAATSLALSALCALTVVDACLPTRTMGIPAFLSMGDAAFRCEVGRISGTSTSHPQCRWFSLASTRHGVCKVMGTRIILATGKRTPTTMMVGGGVTEEKSRQTQEMLDSVQSKYWRGDKPLPRMKRPEELRELERICRQTRLHGLCSGSETHPARYQLREFEGYEELPFLESEIEGQVECVAIHRWRLTSLQSDHQTYQR
eukprot:768431-Hanusia_phi.AAC.16